MVANTVLLVLVYVDDSITTRSAPYAVSSLILKLDIEFTITDLGRLNYLLDIEAHHLSNGIFLTQSKYAMDLLNRTDMVNSKPCSTPMTPSGPKLTKDTGLTFPDVTLYRSTVATLQYLTLTCPDLSFCVNKVCQFMQSPTLNHWMAIKRILRYIKGTTHYGIQIKPIEKFELTAAFTDANWAGCPDDRKSTSGFCVYFAPNLIS
ncbi:uncharacterized mitochondrial protein AtMg00810-like [Telopea speciosissima]|uniref:uncharacterized mitochondrial protein AtMg00810-like n=1 Tax=Telopea speciosissima TaxID=54955 RepID=UPI001CC67A2B|nr:uncharacterized mitochondrial protein AtMg00810-like [Telopea speciosissima]